ncbi:MarR family transcriptional regulator [Bacillus swezeyi]|uniref:MarR family transcriptional regulator n=1 Tax=Bacillus swezeyi TaxID=1925020 RepID=A0A1R1QHA4_9BACI|nr:MarR family transcriptional regulator [Bacillus swezeyi]MEC1261944.1 MarR family transcriptional regulator [Bacillus swezeyi]MED2930333.1 MarR family transcriptional regulator [Bacillus swezeyi]MED2944452.1 MarR family transcriptional regulator [Bacillus swezeyi]MED2966244.1 MarR family transcriptional regulator [Bacillus swezeyi]MED2976764.1 MarR family transcriptional regulator [Bacillus swezeyi]
MKKDEISRDTVEQLIHAFNRLRYTEMKLSFPSQDWKKNEGKALMFLDDTAEGEGKMVSEISQALHVTSPFATQLLNRLDKKGLIYRRMDQDDRRIVRIFLTDEGKKTANEVKKGLNQWFFQLAAYLGGAESTQFAGLIHKMSDFLELGEKKDEKKVEK